MSDKRSIGSRDSQADSDDLKGNRVFPFFSMEISKGKNLCKKAFALTRENGNIHTRQLLSTQPNMFVAIKMAMSVLREYTFLNSFLLIYFC